MKKLTEEQAGHLMEFTRRHYVEYYDLQCELADHLANAIETAWQDNPKLSFEDALQKEFKKFGIFGFTDIVAERRAILTKKYNRLLWGYFRQFLRLPKILLLLAGVVLVYKLIRVHPVFYAVILSALLVLGLVRLVWMYAAYRRRVKKTGHSWLLEDIIYRGGGLSLPFVLPYQVLSHTFGKEYPVAVMLLLSVLLVAYALYQYVLLFMLPSKARHHLEQTYPEYRMKYSG